MDAYRDLRVRTTLAIDDDVLAAARGMAERENKSVGEVISSLARQSLQLSVSNRRTRNGVPLLSMKMDIASVTPELVNRLRDETP
jgi:hypothetical protein